MYFKDRFHKMVRIFATVSECVLCFGDIRSAGGKWRGCHLAVTASTTPNQTHY